MTMTRPAPPPTAPRPDRVPASVWGRYTDDQLAVACPLCHAQRGSVCVVARATRAGRIGAPAEYAHQARVAVADHRPVQATMMGAVRGPRVAPAAQQRSLLETEARAVVQARGTPADLVARMAQPGRYQLKLTHRQAAQLIGLTVRLQDVRQGLDQLLDDIVPGATS